MNTVRITRTGGPGVLDYTELPTPVPGPTQVLVKAHAIGVNMPEVLVRRGAYSWMPPLPAIPGIEMSGAVVAVGSEVNSIRSCSRCTARWRSRCAPIRPSRPFPNRAPNRVPIHPV